MSQICATFHLQSREYCLEGAKIEYNIHTSLRRASIKISQGCKIMALTDTLCKISSKCLHGSNFGLKGPPSNFLHSTTVSSIAKAH